MDDSPKDPKIAGLPKLVSEKPREEDVAKEATAEKQSLLSH